MYKHFETQMHWNKYKNKVIQKLNKGNSVIDQIEIDRIKKELVNFLEMFDSRKISGNKFYWRDNLRNYDNKNNNALLPCNVKLP